MKSNIYGSFPVCTACTEKIGIFTRELGNYCNPSLQCECGGAAFYNSLAVQMVLSHASSLWPFFTLVVFIDGVVYQEGCDGVVYQEGCDGVVYQKGCDGVVYQEGCDGVVYQKGCDGVVYQKGCDGVVYQKGCAL